MSAARLVVHVIAEFSPHEAMGRTIVETAARVPGRHVVVTARAHGAHPCIEEVVELGGRVATFPLGQRSELSLVLDRLSPDVVHVHGGALAPLWTRLFSPARHPFLLSLYAWPTVPQWRQVRGSSWSEMWSSNVLQPRVVATSVLPAAVVRRVLERSGVGCVLTPDPRVVERLDRPGGPIRVVRLRTGATGDDRRASATSPPTVVFAGRAETVRGIDTLLDAFPSVVDQVPDARLRLLLLPRPELPRILARIERSSLRGAVEVVTEPIPDLGAELAAARVGAWPFKFDYTTSPPAMALVEAMSVGLPVVGTDVACIRSVLDDGGGGVVVPPSDAAALARALVSLLSDRARWEAASRQALAVAGRCDWASSAQVTADEYARLLGQVPVSA